MNDEALTTYLNDHLAGSEAGRALAERCAASNSGTPLAAFLRSLVATIEDEQEVVKNLLARSGGKVNAAKAAWRAGEEGAMGCPWCQLTD